MWVVAVVNAFNLFDNMDGQSATMGLVTAAGLATLGIADGNTWLAVAGVALAGACFGFLPHNLLAQPARIFLGDGGSMPLGFAVAALAMIGAGDAAGAWQAVALGLLLVGVPALDTTLVVVSRRRRGLSVLTGGRDHLTHRARQRLRTAFAVAVALGSTQIVLSLLAVAAARGSSTVLAGVAVLYLMAVGVAVALIDTRIPAVPPTAPAPAATTDAVAPPSAARLAAARGAAAGAPRRRRRDLPVAGGLLQRRRLGPDRPRPARVPARRRHRPPAAPGRAGLGRVRRARRAGAVGAGLRAVGGLGRAGGRLRQPDARPRLRARAAACCWSATAATALWALGAFAATAVVVEAWQVVQLLGPGAADQFLGGRLNEPLGYINAQATFSLLALWPLMALAEQRRSARRRRAPRCPAWPSAAASSCCPSPAAPPWRRSAPC